MFEKIQMHKQNTAHLMNFSKRRGNSVKINENHWKAYVTSGDQ